MSVFRRLRGAFRNAMVWGASWFGANLTILSTMHLFGVLPVADAWRAILLVSANAGVTGFLTGGVFSAFLAYAYRKRSLLDIRVGRFALAGAVIAAVFSRALSGVAGVTVGVGGLVAGGILPALLGGATAGVTLKMAQGASRRLIWRASSELEAEQDEVAALLGADAQ